ASRQDLHGRLSLVEGADHVDHRGLAVRMRLPGTDRRPLAQSGIEDEAVDAAELGVQVAERLLHRVAVGDIEGTYGHADRRIRRLQLRPQDLEAIQSPGTQCEILPLRCPPAGHALAESGTGAGDEDGVAIGHGLSSDDGVWPGETPSVARRGWQDGHRNARRARAPAPSSGAPPNRNSSMSVPHRRHGSPARPYAHTRRPGWVSPVVTRTFLVALTSRSRRASSTVPRSPSTSSTGSRGSTPRRKHSSARKIVPIPARFRWSSNASPRLRVGRAQILRTASSTLASGSQSSASRSGPR